MALNKLIRVIHLLGVLTGPAFAPVRSLVVGAGICLSLMIILIGFSAHPRRDLNRIRYFAAVLQTQEIAKALEHYEADCGDYPTSLDGLNALVFNPGTKRWNGPYLREIPQDPWQRPYTYSRSPGVTSPEVSSHGADGRPGGEFFNADISSLRAETPRLESPLERRNRWFFLSTWIVAWIYLIASVIALLTAGWRHF